MANALTMFDPANKANLPAHVKGFFDEESNIADRSTVPSLSYEGKVWTIVMNGQKTKIEKRDQDGDIVPVPVMRVVVLDFAKARGRTYYEGTYDPAKPLVPLCWSDDGVKPDDKVEQKQNPVCATCPKSAKGSKVTDNGKTVTACSQHLMLAVVPASQLTFEPLRLKLAITSVWDKQSPDNDAQNWFAFDNYRDFLKANNVQHTAALVTKMKFDANAQYPKVIFQADRWLEQHELETVKPVVKSDKVASLLAGTWTPAGVDGVKKDDTETGHNAVDREAMEVAQAEQAKLVAAEKARVEAEAAAARKKAAEEALAAEAVAKKVAADKAKAEKAAAKEAAAKAVEGKSFIQPDSDDDDADSIILPGAATAPAVAAKVEKAAVKPAAAAPAGAPVPQDVSALLAEWGED